MVKMSPDFYICCSFCQNLPINFEDKEFANKPYKNICQE